MESGIIRDDAITASSSFDSSNVGPQHGRKTNLLPRVHIPFTGFLAKPTKRRGKNEIHSETFYLLRFHIDRENVVGKRDQMQFMTKKDGNELADLTTPSYADE
ncbi:hypothetical protein RUM43_002675 [Polyplax serrata]|uniref:Uncharacterized protein n=1 Tax=Polyplax serrata TaxID=468196 RepID=A0AAN8NTW4_POLSC